jgi:hypothetical protein
MFFWQADESGVYVNLCSSPRLAKNPPNRPINGAILSDFLALVVSPRRSGSNGF